MGYIQCYDSSVLREASEHPTPALERDAGGVFSRKEVCRLLKIDNRQLKSWERQRLIPELPQFKFTDLLKLKRLLKLRSEHANPRLVKTAMHALDDYLKKLPHDGEDVQIYKEGKRVRIQIGKHRLEPGSGQLLFDFAEEEIKKLLHLPAAQSSNARKMAEKVRDKLEADRWFEHALELEQTGAPFEEIIAAYQKTVELDPKSAGALVNLGTVFFHGHAWAEAESHYLKALSIDPDYALAHFNLGNLYDEQDDCPNAEKHYREALRLHPSYADAHYNMALLYQGTRDFMKAVRHWRAYLKLDTNSTWSKIARRELDKLEAMTIVHGSRPPVGKIQLLRSKKESV
jgi:tetratricopeptide (TPR) repeat protein